MCDALIPTTYLKSLYPQSLTHRLKVDGSSYPFMEAKITYFRIPLLCLILCQFPLSQANLRRIQVLHYPYFGSPSSSSSKCRGKEVHDHSRESSPMSAKLITAQRVISCNAKPIMPQYRDYDISLVSSRVVNRRAKQSCYFIIVL